MSSAATMGRSQSPTCTPQIDGRLPIVAYGLADPCHPEGTNAARPCHSPQTRATRDAATLWAPVRTADPRRPAGASALVSPSEPVQAELQTWLSQAGPCPLLAVRAGMTAP